VQTNIMYNIVHVHALANQKKFIKFRI